ncbi:MAG: ABC transporter permease subunit [Nostocaceae cyanobacterium]|nr:ABC transporter permease subunit [Nostocaceae cyanobacterium]
MGRWGEKEEPNLKSPNFPLLLNLRTFWGLVFVFAVFWSLKVAGVFRGDLVNFGGWNLVFRFLFAVFSLQLDPEFLLITFDATLKTLAYAVCGTFFCVIIGLVGGVLSSEVWWNSVYKGNKIPNLYVIVRAFLAVPRAIHELIWGLFFVNIFGLDPLVGILAIAIPFGAITAKVFSEILDETPREPLLALLNSGVTPLNAFTYSIIPQAFPNLLSYSFYRFECSIRSAAVLGIIGAGGLGYQIHLSLQSLRYEQVWTLIFALLLLSGVTDVLSGWLRQGLELPSRLDLNVLNLKKRNFVDREKKISTSSTNIIQACVGRLCSYSRTLIGCRLENGDTPEQSPHHLFLGAFSLLILSFWYIQADFSKLWSPRTAKLLIGVIQDTFPPQSIDVDKLFELSLQTLAMSILAMTIAGLGGILLSFCAARGEEKITTKTAFLFTRFILLFSRAVPEPIWALIFLFVLFPGILPGAIALGLHNLGILGRLMAEVIENLDQQPLNSLKALGASNSQVFLYGVLPATIPRFLAYILYRWEVCIRATVIVGLVGAGGLGRLLTEQLSSFDYQGLLGTLIVFVGLTFVVDRISAAVRRCLR